MASPVPVKSQPLHNFSLPLLKWTKNHTSNHHRGCRPVDSSQSANSALWPSPTLDLVVQRRSPLLDSAPRQSSMRSDSAAQSESCNASENRKISVTGSAKKGLLAFSSDHKIKKSEQKLAACEIDGVGSKEAKSKLYIRLQTKNKTNDVQNEGNTCTEGGEVEESMAKTWNLRPRMPIRKTSNANGGTSKVGGRSLQENNFEWQQVTPNRSDSTLLWNGIEEDASTKKQKKQKFAISLSRREIEEDIFALTGSKPARRPKKRAKMVQRQLDNLFPGLWLASITPDSYKVSEAPLKG
ncbi:hypothetical protein U1Q18_036138 [Sarracenia purpurea var. burkii]